MKTKFFLVCVVILVSSSLVWAENDKSYSDRRLNDRVAPLEGQLTKLERQIGELRASVRDLQSKVEGGEGKANVALWISVPIVMVIFGVICLVFWPKKAVAVAINSDRADKNKCPRCGWEHGPGDTVCKNPNCKTQF